MVATQAKLRQLNPRARDLNKAERHRLVETVKRLAIPVSGTMGFAKAEVTAGGLALNEVDRKTMQVKKHPGLYVFGELLDVTGPIGGLNFQAAFSTAELAARHATA
jgi:predicted flavoprotein YhiN